VSIHLHFYAFQLILVTDSGNNSRGGASEEHCGKCNITGLHCELQSMEYDAQFQIYFTILEIVIVTNVITFK
jgi:hypothetical protein